MFLLGLMFGFLLGLYVRVLCSGLGLGLAQVLGQVGKVGKVGKVGVVRAIYNL